MSAVEKSHINTLDEDKPLPDSGFASLMASLSVRLFAYPTVEGAVPDARNVCRHSENYKP
jgi:hypothetical protein